MKPEEFLKKYFQEKMTKRKFEKIKNLDLLSNGILDSKAEDTFNSLIDQEFSKSLSQKSNFGISEAIFNQFKTNIGSRK